MKAALKALLLFVASSIALSASAGTDVLVTYYHNDILGSPVAATDENGNELWRESYHPFGARKHEPAGSGGNDLWYTGKELDESGLTYMGDRYYDAVIGRFTAVDPVSFDENIPSTFSRYTYANNNPYRFVDPDGNIPIPLIIYGIYKVASAASDAAEIAANVSAGNYAGAALTAAGSLDPTGITNKARKVKKLVSSSGGKVPKRGTTTLYRAVGPDELSDIQRTGQLINRGSAEGKYFTSSSEHASDYARQAVRAFGDPPYTTVRTQVPNSALPKPVSVDGGIPAYVVPDKALRGLKPEVLDTMAVP